VLIADAGNDRIIEVTPEGRIVWQFPDPAAPPPPVPFRYPDDAFFTPDGRRIIANHEDTHFISLIDYRSRRIVWTYGTPAVRAPARISSTRPTTLTCCPTAGSWSPTSRIAGS
jgi:DNA-binding beta-propeller fold protein YncE